MKRTLTAATAVVVSSAGAVGLAGTAAAVTNPQAPVQDPVDTSLTHSVGQGVDAVHKTVGDVVPAQPSAPRAGEPQQSGGAGQPDSLGNTVSRTLGTVAGQPQVAAQPRSGGDSPAGTPPLVKPLANVTQGVVKTDDKDGIVGSLARGVAGESQSLQHGTAAPRSGEPNSQPVTKNVDKLAPVAEAVGGLTSGDLAPAAKGVVGLLAQ